MSTTCQLFKWLLLLLSIITLAKTSELSNYTYQIEKQGSHHFIYPDLFRNGSFYLFELFSYEYLADTNSCSSLQVDWSISIYKDGETRKQLSSWVLLSNDVLFMGDTQKGLSANRLTFTGYSHLNDTHRKYSFYEYDVDSRDVKVLEDFDVGGGEDGIVERTDVSTNTVDAEDSCVFGFEGKRKRFFLPDDFNVNSEFKKSVTVSDSMIDQFSIVGDVNKVSKSVLLSRNLKLDLELNILKSGTGLDMFVSCRSICWKRNRFDKSVQCSQFDESGEIVFNRNVTFSKIVKIVSVKDLQEGRILLVTKTIDSTGMYFADLRNDVVTVPRDFSEDFSDCNLSKNGHLTFDAKEIEGEVVVEYVCRKGNVYTFKHFVLNKYRDNFTKDKVADNDDEFLHTDVEVV